MYVQLCLYNIHMYIYIYICVSLSSLISLRIIIIIIIAILTLITLILIIGLDAVREHALEDALGGVHLAGARFGAITND